MNRHEIEIQNFTNQLVEASLIPISEARVRLDEQIGRGEIGSLPTCEVYYDYPTIWSLNRRHLLPKFAELINLTPRQLLPREVGPLKLNPNITVTNERHFITPIVRRAREMGYEKIYVDTTGIYFYLKLEDLGPKAQAYHTLTSEIISACRMKPTATEENERSAQERLDEIITLSLNPAPTHGVFYHYSRILAGKTKYLELQQLDPNDPLPSKIGPNELNPYRIFANQFHFISKIVKQTKEDGFEGANVGKSGITYYLKPEDLGPIAKNLYEQFFIPIERLKKEIKIIVNEAQKNKDVVPDKIIKTFTQKYSPHQIKRSNYELRRYYNEYGFSVDLNIDWKQHTQPLVMKIFFDYKELEMNND